MDVEDVSLTEVMNLLEAEPLSGSEGGVIPLLDLTFLLFVSSWPCWYPQEKKKKPKKNTNTLHKKLKNWIVKNSYENTISCAVVEAFRFFKFLEGI